MKRSIARFAAALLCLASAGATQAMVLAVNEGVSYRVPVEEIRARYAALAADLAKLTGEAVTVEPVDDYQTLRQGLADRKYDLAIVHPARRPASIAAQVSASPIPRRRIDSSVDTQ